MENSSKKDFLSGKSSYSFGKTRDGRHVFHVDERVIKELFERDALVGITLEKSREKIDAIFAQSAVFGNFDWRVVQYFHF